MSRVWKLTVRVATCSAVIAILAVQPALASPREPARGSIFRSLIQKIVRVLDTIDIGFPPG